MRYHNLSASKRIDSIVRLCVTTAIIVISILALIPDNPTLAADQVTESAAAVTPQSNARATEGNVLDELVLKVKLDTARRALVRGAFAEAETLYLRILQQYPNNADACAGLASAMLRQGRTADAIQQLNTFAQNHPDDAQIFLALGQAYIEDQRTDKALYWLNRARSLDSTLPDVDYYFGTAALKDSRPLEAYQILSEVKPSNQEMAWAQQLAMGAALAQLGLQKEASEHFQRVSKEAGDTTFGQQARQFQTQLDDAIEKTPRLRGSLKATTRYDDNPGVVPSSDIFSRSQERMHTYGNLYRAQFNYDLYRAYNKSITAGYTMMGTANHETHIFDLQDNAFYLAGAKRSLWRGKPVTWALRSDYDHLIVGSDTFLSRTSVTPSLTIQNSDRTATTLLTRFTDYNFINQHAGADTAFDQDSDDIAVGIFQKKLLGNPNTSLTYGYQYNNNQARGSNYDFQGHRFLLGMICRLGQKWELNISNWFYLRNYDNRHSNLALDRRDRQYTLQVGLRRALRKQLDLTLDYLYDRNSSNAKTNDYDRQLFEIGLEYRF